MEYQVGVLHSRPREDEASCSYYWERQFRPLRPVRASLSEVAGDLLAAQLWIQREQRKRAKFEARSRRRDDSYCESDDWPLDSYEVHIRVTTG